MKTDNLGIPYFDESDKGEQIFCTLPKSRYKKTTNSYFCKLLTLKDYIIKYSKNEINKDDYLQMLKIFQETKNEITLTDFPIGYYEEEGILKGTIIPYYQDSISLLQTTENRNLADLKKYYYHDDDDLHNLYVLLNNILDILEELQNNNISYLDSNPSNFLIKDNQIKLIDFDPKYIKYGINKQNISDLLSRFDDLIFFLHLNLNLDNSNILVITGHDAYYKKRSDVNNIKNYKNSENFVKAIYQARNFKVMRKHLVK